jgi:hypothetical protein
MPSKPRRAITLSSFSVYECPEKNSCILPFLLERIAEIRVLGNHRASFECD